jgi:hypothetical protein
MISEDIHAFNKLKDGGFKIWLDQEITCNHIGPYKFTGDFEKWYNKTVHITKPILPVMKKQL